MSNSTLKAFRFIVKNISKELNIKYNKAMKVAFKLLVDVKKENPNITYEKLANVSSKYLIQHLDKYRKLSKEIY